jgi:hypothetical protein
VLFVKIQSINKDKVNKFKINLVLERFLICKTNETWFVKRESIRDISLFPNSMIEDSRLHNHVREASLENYLGQLIYFFLPKTEFIPKTKFLETETKIT